MKACRAFQLLGLALSVTALAACGDSKISAVKDSRMRGDEFTIGEMLEKIKECKSTDWSSEVVNNSTVVTHTCTVKTDDALVKSAKQNELEALSVHASLQDLSVVRAVREAETAHANALRRQELRSARVVEALAGLDREVENIGNAQPVRSVRMLGSFARPPEAPDPAAWEARKAENTARIGVRREAVLAEAEVDKQKEQSEIASALQAIDDALAKQQQFKERVDAAHNAVIKEVEAYYAKDHALSVKTSFRYREGANAEVLNSVLFVDGEKAREGFPSYLVNPAQMPRYLQQATKQGFNLRANELFDQRFSK